MSKRVLKTFRPGLSVAPGRLSSIPGKEARRRIDAPWKKWYGWKRWKDIRDAVLLRDNYTCQMCPTKEWDTSKLVCDHVNPHRGIEAFFWAGPFQTLCQFCHSVHKQSQEGGSTAKIYPDWLRPSAIPLTIVCGPPCAGKSTYAANHMGKYDLVIDLDVIAHGLSGQGLHSWDRDQWLEPALRKRNAMLAYLSREPRFNAAWFIVAEPDPTWREWWQHKLNPQSIVVLKTDQRECETRAIVDGRDYTHTHLQIEAWFNRYQPRKGDVLIEA